MANYVLIATHTIHANDMTCQFTSTICMSNSFNMLAATILANYTIHYVILYYTMYSTLHISCIWYDTCIHPQSFHPIMDKFHMTSQA